MDRGVEIALDENVECNHSQGDLVAGNPRVRVNERGAPLNSGVAVLSRTPAGHRCGFVEDAHVNSRQHAYHD